MSTLKRNILKFKLVNKGTTVHGTGATVGDSNLVQFELLLTGKAEKIHDVLLAKVRKLSRYNREAVQNCLSPVREKP